MTFDIPEDLATRIENLADKQGSTIEDFFARVARPHEPKKPRMTMADLARIALEANMATDHPVDTSARSREILNTEYADYLNGVERRDRYRGSGYRASAGQRRAWPARGAYCDIGVA